MHRAINENREHRRNLQNNRRNGSKPNFSLGDFVLVSNVLKRSRPKLSVRWSGPHRIVEVFSDHIFAIQHLITQAQTEVHSSRLRFYGDSSLNISEDLCAQVAFDGDGYEIERFCWMSLE